MLRSHGHAHDLPSAELVAPRRLTHLTVFAPDGFGPAEVAVLSGLRRVQVGDVDPLRVQLIGLGVPGDFRHELFGPARVWESATPFVGPAHVGRQGQERSLRKALRRELRRLAQHGLLAEAALAVCSVWSSTEKFPAHSVWDMRRISAWAAFARLRTACRRGRVSVRTAGDRRPQPRRARRSCPRETPRSPASSLTTQI